MKNEIGLEGLRYGSGQERILRVLLSVNRRGRITKYRLAKEASVSQSYAFTILKGLEKKGWVQGTTVMDAPTLFTHWREMTDHRLFREYHVQDPERLLKSAEMDYALTGYFAENQVGGYLFPRYLEFYISPQDGSKWHSLLAENGYVGKGNVSIMLADEHVFYDRMEVGSWPIVSMQQLIVDLLRTGAECAEAADILIRRTYR